MTSSNKYKVIKRKHPDLYNNQDLADDISKLRQYITEDVSTNAFNINDQVWSKSYIEGTVNEISGNYKQIKVMHKEIDKLDLISDYQLLLAYREKILDNSNINNLPPTLSLADYSEFNYLNNYTTYVNNYNSLTDWNINRYDNFNYMFKDVKVDFGISIQNWNVSHVTTMVGTFQNCKHNTQLNWFINNQNISVTNMAYMFKDSSFNKEFYIWNAGNQIAYLNKVTSMEEMFSGASEFNKSLYNFNTDVSLVNLKGMFKNAKKFNQYFDGVNIGTNSAPIWRNGNYGYPQCLNQWQVHNVTNMSEMFMGAESFNSQLLYRVASDRSAIWNTHNVKDMSKMYKDAKNFNKHFWRQYVVTGYVEPKSYFQTQNVIDMSEMFSGATLFNGEVFFDTSNVANMSGMFKNSNFNNGSVIPQTRDDETSGLGPNNFDTWDTHNVKDMSGMFMSTPFNQDISQWTVKNVTNMTSMFQDASSFNYPLGRWDLCSNVITTNMFSGATKILNNYYHTTPDVINQRLQFYPGSNQIIKSGVSNPSVYGPILNDWDVTRVDDMSGLFMNSNLCQDIGNWGVSNVTDMSEMFRNTNFNKDISHWNVQKVTSMERMFQNCTNYNMSFSSIFNNIRSISWQTDSLENTSFMFNNAISFDRELSYWNTSSVTDMASMFAGAVAFNKDLSSWDVSRVEFMNFMFGGATNFNGNISTWNTHNVKNMQGMFQHARNFNQDISWNTHNVENMQDMFRGATNFNGNISNWNTYNVKYMIRMFGDSSFNRDISGWKVNNVRDMRNMFENANMFNQDIRQWNVNNVTYMDNMFKNATMFNVPLGQWDLCSNILTNSNTITDMFFGATEMYNNYYHQSPTVTPSYRLQFYPGSRAIFDEAIQNPSKYGPTLNHWDVTRVDDMSGLFMGSNFNQTINHWNVKNVTNMVGMFKDSSFNQTLANWETNKVTDMSGMFMNSRFNKPIWQNGMSDVSNISYMFTNSPFNQDIATNWGIQNVVTMEGMFMDSSFNHTTINRLKPSKEKLKNTSKMFKGSNFNNSFIGVVDVWDVDNVTDMSEMFMNNSSFNQQLTRDSNNFGNNQYIYEVYWLSAMGWIGQHYNQQIMWYTSNLRNTSRMFKNASLFNKGFNYNVRSLTTTQPRVFYYDGFRRFYFTTFFQTQKVTDMSEMFSGATQFNSPVNFDTANVENMSGMFKNSSFNDSSIVPKVIVQQAYNNTGLTEFNSTIEIFRYNSWNTHKVTDMSEMFMNNTQFNQDITGWNISSVKNMSNMFNGANSFNQDLSDWDVSGVENMSGMFMNNTQFNRDITGWKIISVKNMSNMFNGARDFNQDISGWDVSGVENMSGMFKDSTFNPDIGIWKVYKVTDMSGMFMNNNNFNRDISGWKISNVKNMSNMFNGASNFSQNIGIWDVSNVENMSGMLKNTNFNPDISGWFTHKVTDMSEMFMGNNNFNRDISGWNVSGVTDMSGMFYGATSFNQNLSKWNLNSVTNTTNMFYGANFMLNYYHETPRVLEQRLQFSPLNNTILGDILRLNNISDITEKYGIINNWDVARITNMDLLFINNNNFGNSNNSNEYIGNWDVGNVTSMQGMFYNSDFNQDISGWDVSGVTDMTSMFRGATNFNQNLSDWIVNSVTSMSSMFSNATNFNQDISGWNVSGVENMIGMFSGASSFNQNLSNWNLNSVTNTTNMFSGATAMLDRFNGTIPGSRQLTDSPNKAHWHEYFKEE